MRIVTKSEVEQLLTPAQAIDIVRSTFERTATSDVVQPLRTVVRAPGRSAVLGSMPAYIANGDGGEFGIKAVLVDPGNAARGFDTHLGVIIVFDSDLGKPRAVIEAGSVTARRTAAASAVATSALAGDAAGNIALLGSGAQAREHLRALNEILPMRKVSVWSRQRAHAVQLDVWAQDALGIALTVTEDVTGATTSADIVCTLTSSKDPVISADDIRPGTHINAVGACFPTSRELSSDLVASARIIVDNEDSARSEAGDLIIPWREGRFTFPQHLVELGQVLRDPGVGRQSPDQVTIFESLGFGALDVACAAQIAELAESTGAGTVVEID